MIRLFYGKHVKYILPGVMWYFSKGVDINPQFPPITDERRYMEQDNRNITIDSLN